MIVNKKENELTLYVLRSPLRNGYGYSLGKFGNSDNFGNLRNIIEDVMGMRERHDLYIQIEMDYKDIKSGSKNRRFPQGIENIWLHKLSSGAH